MQLLERFKLISQTDEEANWWRRLLKAKFATKKGIWLADWILRTAHSFFPVLGEIFRKILHAFCYNLFFPPWKGTKLTVIMTMCLWHTQELYWNLDRQIEIDQWFDYLCARSDTSVWIHSRHLDWENDALMVGCKIQKEIWWYCCRIFSFFCQPWNAITLPDSIIGNTGCDKPWHFSKWLTPFPRIIKPEQRAILI